MLSKIICDNCGKLNRSLSIRRYKDKFLCFNCWRNTQSNIIGIKQYKYLEPLSVCKTIHFALTSSQNTALINKQKKLKIRISEYMRLLILNDIDN